METPLDPPFAKHPEFPTMLARLREELELGDRHKAGMAFAVVEIEDMVPEQDGEVIRERLITRAMSATQRSIRHQRSLTRKIADAVFRIDRYLFISLGSVSAGTLRVPLGRIVHQMRNELYSTPDIHAMRLRRQLTLGVAHWLPEVGFITEQMMFTKAWQAFLQAKDMGGLADPTGFLGLTASNLDLVRVQVYDWGHSEVSPRAMTGPIERSMASSRRPVVAKTTPELATKKSWLFWK